MNLPNAELSEKVIACAFRVHQRMGFGFVESVYERCLAIEFRKNGISAHFQHPVPVYYDGDEVGNFVTDVKIGDDLIIELKSVQKLAMAHEAQLVNYLVATGTDNGLLINFGERKVEVKRKFRLYQPSSLPAQSPVPPSPNPENPVNPV